MGQLCIAETNFLLEMHNEEVRTAKSEQAKAAKKAKLEQERAARKAKRKR